QVEVAVRQLTVREEDGRERQSAILDLRNEDAAAASRAVGTSLALVHQAVGVARLDLAGEVEFCLVDLGQFGDELDALAWRQVGRLVTNDRLVQRATLFDDARSIDRVQFD